VAKVALAKSIRFGALKAFPARERALNLPERER